MSTSLRFIITTVLLILYSLKHGMGTYVGVIDWTSGLGLCK